MNIRSMLFSVLFLTVSTYAGIFLNVKDPPFNAFGNGIDNDRANIQAALDTAAAHLGGTVYLPAGAYLIDNVVVEGDRVYGLLVSSNTKILGDGMGSTVISMAPNCPASAEACRIIANK